MWATSVKEEKDYKLWPANKADCSWQCLQPRLLSLLCVKLNIDDLQADILCQHHSPDQRLEQSSKLCTGIV